MGPKSKFNLEAYYVYRYQSVKDYFFQRIEKDKKPILQIASRLWPGGNQRYYSDVIRFWAKEFIANNRLPNFRQGQHAKSESILADKDVAFFVKKYILETKASLCSLSTISRHINLNIVPEFMNNQLGAVSPSILSKYLKLWGVTFKIKGKSIYYDGHERSDVVQYRKEWAKRMLQYRKQMNTFDEASITEANIMEGDKKIVMVTHDECTFYSNDGNKILWILEGEEQSSLRHKGPDAFIMVSEFQCPCHVTMRSVSDPEKTSRTLFYAGAGRDGRWTAEMMIEQYKKVVKIFDELYPMSQRLFLFDNSSNHSAYAEDALLAGRTNRHTKEVCYKTEVVREESSVVSKDDTWRSYRDTGYIRGGRRHVQKICTYVCNFFIFY
ncbi:hypothetical protein G6F56_000260 [Rhizopus delemar]|nr:hypothetical protein G6F56_000260 [Rhizopus delemar]